MTFYSSISEYYDSIFPVDEKEMAFVKIRLDGRKAMLDIGCGTGNKTVHLAEEGRKIEAFDGDAAMIAAAKRQNSAPGLEYRVLDMAALGKAFVPQSFDAALCLGNTLAHLPGPDEAAALLRSLYALLQPGGLAIIQILNYERILREKAFELPLLDNDKIRFTRHYRPADCGLRFITRLVIKKTGQEIDNDIPLYPLQKRELDLMLADAGFSLAEHYGSYQGEPLKPDSFPLIVLARK